MSAASPAQIRTIHALKGRAGLDDDSYRDLLARAAGVRSSKGLSHSEALGIIDRLKALSGQQPGRGNATSRPAGALKLSGPYAGICRALWISGWQLGVVADRRDTALVAFVRRQTGIDHLNWLRDAADARKAIEALKGWLAREAGVVWPKRATAAQPGGRTVNLRKWAEVKAQLALLGETRRVPGDADLDALMTELGARVRKLGGRR